MELHLLFKALTLLGAILLPRFSNCQDIQFDLLSSGCGDPGVPRGDCGRCPNWIKINGYNYSKNRRGFNVVAVSAVTGFVLGTGSFDTHGNSGDSSQMIAFLEKYRYMPNVIVAGVVKDEGTARLSYSLRHEIKRWIRQDCSLYEYRASYLFLGSNANINPSFLKQVSPGVHRGPSRYTVSIPRVSQDCAPLRPPRNGMIASDKSIALIFCKSYNYPTSRIPPYYRCEGGRWRDPYENKQVIDVDCTERFPARGLPLNVFTYWSYEGDCNAADTRREIWNKIKTLSICESKNGCTETNLNMKCG